MKIRGVLQTPDGRWRVEIVQQGAQVFYRLINGEDVVDKLAIASLQLKLAEAGVDMADMVEVPEGAPSARAADQDIA